MIEIGKVNKLTICSENHSGFYLKSDDSDEEIFMPPSLAPDGVKVGQILKVFVYMDTTNSLIATAKTPYAQVGEYAVMKAIHVKDFGAFFDWGIEKDLLVPGNEQKISVTEGDEYLLRVCIEEGTDRIFGTSKFAKYVQESDFDIVEGDKVRVVPVLREELGYRSIINKKFIGMIYHNEIFSNIQLDMTLDGVVKKIREDGLVDVALQTQGFKNIIEAKEMILDTLEKSGGRLALHDKSDPDLIRNSLGMSKQTFKKAIGMLYKDRAIIINKDGIELGKK